MMKRTCTALFNNEPHASCRTIGVRLPQSLSITSCPVIAGAGPKPNKVVLVACMRKLLAYPQRHRKNRKAMGRIHPHGLTGKTVAHYS
ncbi:hypothetical protein Bxe_A3758 [Paraburkholderia xenovorans LB400]|uniref:Uncharacterized protein n=1 Tax=Paraburkholderia xenovorans (strain LB400) TaxID=266265 RepID=Q144K5_PARXL|nr:hypothetical protein Bxe_A3758 [Paraburkholderia xenovorans LB400]